METAKDEMNIDPQLYAKDPKFRFSGDLNEKEQKKEDEYNRIREKLKSQTPRNNKKNNTSLKKYHFLPFISDENCAF